MQVTATYSDWLSDPDNLHALDETEGMTFPGTGKDALRHHRQGPSTAVTVNGEQPGRLPQAFAGASRDLQPAWGNGNGFTSSGPLLSTLFTIVPTG